jgi:hypothetical protein
LPGAAVTCTETSIFQVLQSTSILDISL